MTDESGDMCPLSIEEWYHAFSLPREAQLNYVVTATKFVLAEDKTARRHGISTWRLLDILGVQQGDLRERVKRILMDATGIREKEYIGRPFAGWVTLQYHTRPGGPGITRRLWHDYRGDHIRPDRPSRYQPT